MNNWTNLTVILLTILFMPPSLYAKNSNDRPEYQENPYRIKLHSVQHRISKPGGIIVSDLSGDGLLDFIVSTKENDFGKGRSTIAVYDHYGELLWFEDSLDIVLNAEAERYGLPGLHGPGVSASDVDGDGNNEVIHLGLNNEIIVRDGLTGEIKKRYEISLPNEGLSAHINHFMKVLKSKPLRTALKELLRFPKRWSFFQIVNLEGGGDDEIILQADPLPFRWLKAVSLKTGKTLWENHEYTGLQHGGFRAADIDGDGYDEVVGGVIIDHDGSVGNQWEYRSFNGHFDSLAIGDILPDEAGLEWILLEEGHRGDDRTALLGAKKAYFYHSLNGMEPQNAAIGEFDPNSPGLEIWCRSRFNTDQRPWVINSLGKTIASYRLNETKPADWSEEGIEVINRIDWYGETQQYIAAKERHVDGKIAVINPLTGEFVRWWDENAARIYIVDIAGDYREEIVVLNSKENEIRVYSNSEENSHADRERYWDTNSYKRQKLNYNYYSP